MSKENDLSVFGADNAQSVISAALAQADDGELFIERSQSESLVFDDGRLRSASFDESQGFGLRAVSGEMAAYAHSSDLTIEALKRAAATVRSGLNSGGPVNVDVSPAHSKTKLYGTDNPVEAQSFATKVNLLETVNQFTRGLDPRVKQVSVSVASSWQKVTIVRADGQVYHDVRPLTRFGVSAVTENNKTSGQGSHGFGGRNIIFSKITATYRNSGC